MYYKHLLHHPHSRWFPVSCDSIFRNTKNSVTLNWLKPIKKKRPAKAERLHSFHIILPGTFSVKLPPLRLSFPFPSCHSPVLPPALTHPRHPPGPDEYKCSVLLRYRYAPSNTGASLDSYLTSPYCCSKYGGRHGV